MNTMYTDHAQRARAEEAESARRLERVRERERQEAEARRRREEEARQDAEKARDDRARDQATREKEEARRRYIMAGGNPDEFEADYGRMRPQILAQRAQRQALERIRQLKASISTSL